MNFLSAGLLLFFDDRDSFLFLCFIVEELLPFYFSDGMIGFEKKHQKKNQKKIIRFDRCCCCSLQADSFIFEHLIAKFLPKLSAHFKKIDLPVILITCQWFSTLFVKSLPLE